MVHCCVKTRIALVQTPCALGDKAENIRRMERCLDRVEADVYTFGELFVTGYMCRDLLPRLAEDLEGKSIKRISGLAEERGVDIVFGMPTLDEEREGLIHNSALAAASDGSLQRYDKIHLANFGPFEEGFYFAEGASPAIFELGRKKIGLCICYDLFFSDLAKTYAIEGTDALLCLSASPSTSRDQFERMIPARAMENTAYALYANNVGTQLNMVFFGGSQANGPRGNQIAKARYFEEDAVVVEIDPQEIALARRMRPTIRDTGVPLARASD